jgi:hypothetical protein
MRTPGEGTAARMNRNFAEAFVDGMLTRAHWERSTRQADSDYEEVMDKPYTKTKTEGALQSPFTWFFADFSLTTL